MLILFFNFWAIFGGKIGVAATHASYGLGLPVLARKLAHWKDLLGQPLSRNHVLILRDEILRGEPR